MPDNTRALITGSREGVWTHSDVDWLASIVHTLGITTLYNGGAPGYDQICASPAMASFWSARGVEIVTKPALWDVYGPGAGPVRNGQMVRAVGPQGYCFAFKGNRGTADTIRQARLHGLHLVEAHAETHGHACLNCGHRWICTGASTLWCVCRH